MADPLREALDGLSRAPGVRGALIVDALAGVPVLAELSEGVDGAAVAALASSLFGRAQRGAAAAGYGPLHMLQLEAADGHVLVAHAGDLAVVAVAEVDAQLGLVRLSAQQAAEALR